MGTHSQHLLQNCLLDVSKLGWDDVLMARTCIKVFQADRPGADPGQGKTRSPGVPFFKKLLRPEGYSNKPKA